jgi:hypothetical protein
LCFNALGKKTHYKVEDSHEIHINSVNSLYYYVHDLPLYLVCPDVLSTVGETSCGIGEELIESDVFLTIFLFIYLFIYLYLRCKLYSLPVDQIKNNSHFAQELVTFVVGDHIMHHPLTPLPYLTASDLIQIPFLRLFPVLAVLIVRL